MGALAEKIGRVIQEPERLYESSVGNLRRIRSDSTTQRGIPVTDARTDEAAPLRVCSIISGDLLYRFRS